MVMVIDFDDVLFDVSKFKSACEKAGINFSDKIYQKSKIHGIYNPKKHLKLINKSKKEFLSIVKQSKKFLFPGIIKKLKKLGKNNKLILLSKGNFWFQKQKIKNSGIKFFFDEIFITADSKLKIFQENIMPKYGHEKIVFIDDKKAELQEVKKAYPNIVVKNSLS